MHFFSTLTAARSLAIARCNCPRPGPRCSQTRPLRSHGQPLYLRLELGGRDRSSAEWCSRPGEAKEPAPISMGAEGKTARDSRSTERRLGSTWAGRAGSRRQSGSGLESKLASSASTMSALRNEACSMSLAVLRVQSREGGRRAQRRCRFRRRRAAISRREESCAHPSSVPAGLFQLCLHDDLTDFSRADFVPLLTATALRSASPLSQPPFASSVAHRRPAADSSKSRRFAVESP